MGKKKKTKKAKKTDVKSSTASNGKNNSTGSSNLLTPALISLAIVIVSALAIMLLVLPKEQSAISERQLNRQAKQHASLVAITIENLQNKMNAAAKQEQVFTTIAKANTSEMSTLSKKLSSYFPAAESTLVLPLDAKGLTGLRKHGIKLRNNIEASLINKLEDGEPVFPEAYPYKNPTHFTMVAAVTNLLGEVAGALLIRFPIDYLQAPLTEIVGNSGHTQLLQSFNNRNTILIDAGTPNNSEPAISQQIRNTAWKIRFTPSSEIMKESSISPWTLLLLLAIPALLIPAWHAFSLRKVATSLDRDIDSLHTYTQSLLSGNKQMPPMFENTAIEQLAKVIGRFRKQASKQPIASVTQAKKAAPVARSNEEIAQDDSTPMNVPQVSVPDEAFRAYDIRGVADKLLTDDVVYAIGLAIGSEALEKSQDSIVLACDGRLSSPRIKQALTNGLVASGQHVIDLGQVPTPVMYFATHHLETGAGVIITGSHNAKEYNGLKLVLDGHPLSGEHIQGIKQRIIDRNYIEGQGSIREESVTDAYIDIITGDIAVAMSLKIVVDAHNGMGGIIGPRLLEELGCEVIGINCEPDGNFPKHAPDPTKAENQTELKAAVLEHKANFGIAFDGDADRVCVVGADGEAIEPDVLLMLFSQDIVSRNPGADIVFDVKCTRHLSSIISQYGGRPIMWKSGHSCIKEKMMQTGALLGGEYTGHICFKERWFGFDDGIYSAARLVEIVSTSGLSLTELVQDYPSSVCTPEIIIDTTESQKFAIVNALTDNAQFGAGKITTLDGIRVDYPDGWGLIRPSNTIAAITLRFEADSDDAMERIQAIFREQISLVNPTLASAF